MKSTARHVAATLAVVVTGLVVGLLAFVWSGVYNFAADVPHTAPVTAMLEILRERSVATRAASVQVPDLSRPEAILQGAGNYEAMCSGCHLSPGVDASAMSVGLYPAPPNLARQKVEPRQAFWVVKHGIKASGMPAWGKSMGDEVIWNMTAFLQELPRLDEKHYREMVAKSGGHEHGDGEPPGRAGAPGDHHAAGLQQAPGAGRDDHQHSKDGHHGGAHAGPQVGAASSPATGEPAAPDNMHRHADGKKHPHPPSKAPIAKHRDDGHRH